jgi:hypothetical protein
MIFDITPSWWMRFDRDPYGIQVELSLATVNKVRFVSPGFEPTSVDDLVRSSIE